jgi:hypothetical protein
MKEMGKRILYKGGNEVIEKLKNWEEGDEREEKLQ